MLRPLPGPSVRGGQKALAFIRKARQAQAGAPRGVEVGFYGRDAQKAALAEFGTRGRDGRYRQPPRPFFRRSIKRMPEVVGPIVRQRVNPLTMAVDDGLAEAVGAAAAAEVAVVIRSFSEPANRPGTVRQKGRRDPLVDTGELARAPKFKVRRTSRG